MDRAQKIGTMEKFDGFAPLRNGLRRLARERSEWAGFPMPLERRPLTIEPKFPNAKEISSISRREFDEAEAKLRDGLTIRARFYSAHKRGYVLIWEKDGKVDWGVERGHPLTTLLDTLDCADAWGVEQEGAAVQTLGTMLRHRVFKQYLLTGMFLETSERSGVHYLFRRLRPTIAISTRTGGARVLAALCMHPIGYYEGTYAGAMTPTDDVIAHLAMMRGDERLFWSRCNQHPAWAPQAAMF